MSQETSIQQGILSVGCSLAADLRGMLVEDGGIHGSSPRHPLHPWQGGGQITNVSRAIAIHTFRCSVLVLAFQYVTPS